MHSLTPEYLDRLRFDAEQATTLRAIGEYRGKLALFYAQAPEVLKGLREIAAIESSESSNRLEGVIVPSKRQQVRDAVPARKAPFSTSDIEAVCAGVSRDTVRLVLRAMKTEGIIASTGKGRSAKWISLPGIGKD